MICFGAPKSDVRKSQMIGKSFLTTSAGQLEENADPLTVLERIMTFTARVNFIFPLEPIKTTFKNYHSKNVRPIYLLKRVS